MGGKTGTTTSKVQIPQEVLQRYNAVNARAENVAQTPFQTYSTNPNAFVAPLNTTQQAGVANTNAAAGMAQPYFGQATEAFGQGLGAAVPFTLAGGQAVNPSNLDSAAINKYMSPYLGTVLGTTMAAQNQQNAQQRSAMQGDAIQAGAFGGDRANIGQANLAYQQNLSNSQTIANLLNQGYGQALGTAQQQQGVGLSADQANRAALQQTGQGLFNQFTGYGQGVAGLGAASQNAALQGAQAQLQAGQVGQQTEQAGLSALYNQFLQQQSYPFQVAQFLANIAMGTGALSGSTTSTTQPMPFFSDERLKDDVEPIGETYDGQKIVRFRYKGQPQRQLGLVAQDVEQHHPEAVGQSHGYKTVDYEAATDDAAEYGGGLRPRRYAGGGFADPNDLASLAAQRAQMYAALPWAQAGLYGGQPGTTPRGGAQGIVPAASLHVPSLVTAKAPTGGPPKTGLQEVAGLAKDVADMGNTAQGLGKAYDGLKGAAGKAEDFVKGLFAPKEEWGDRPWDAEPKASGGLVADNDDSPQGIYEPAAGLRIPQGKTDAKLNPAQPPSSSPAGGLGSTIKDAASLIGAAGTIGKGVGWLGGLLGFEDGGRVGYAEGGEPDDPGSIPSIIAAAAERHGVPLKLANAIFAQESGLNPTIVGDNGQSVGLGQIKGTTAERPGYGVAPIPLDRRIDPEANANFAMEYLAKKARHLGYDPQNEAHWQNVAEAYNGGGDPRYWQNVSRRLGMPVSNPATATAGLAPRTERPIETNVSTMTEGLAPRESFGQTQGEVQQPRERGWLDRNRDWLLPALQFVGTTASSPSRYLGAALLQGAAGAAKGIGQAAELEQRQQALDTGRMGQNTQAANLGLQQQVQQHAMTLNAYDKATGQFIVFGPDGKPTRMLANDFYARMRSGQAPRLVPNGIQGVPTAASPSGAAPAVPEVPGVASPAPVAPKPEALPKGVALPDKPTEATNPSEYLYTVPVRSAGQREMDAERNLYQETVPDEATRGRIREYVQSLKNAGNTAQSNRAALLELADNAVRPDGWLTSGAMIEDRQQLASIINTAMRIAGFKEQFDPKELAASEIARKAFFGRVAEQARGMGERSAIALPLLEQGIVNGKLSPDTIKTMIADLFVADQKAVDLAAYAKKYEQGAGGIFPLGANVVNAFNQDFGEDHYRRERNMLMDVMTPNKVPGADQKASPLHFMINPHAGEQFPDMVKKLTPAVFERVYGPGMYRYITGRVN